MTDNIHSQFCIYRNKKIKNHCCCTYEINCNNVPFLLNLKYDIMRQEILVNGIQNSIIINTQENANIHSIMENHLFNNNDTIAKINTCLKDIRNSL